MKKAILMFSILVLYIQCSVRLMAPPLFVNGSNGIEKIDTSILSRYSNEDSLMTGRKVVYRQGRHTVTVNSIYGVKGHDYHLIIKDAHNEDFLSVRRKDYRISLFTRESRNLKKPDFVNKFEYYGNGSLRLKFTEQNIQKLIYQKEPYFINTGVYKIYAEDGSLKTMIDYDKEYTFTLKDVLKLYKNKIDKKRSNIDISQSFVAHSFNPKDSIDVFHKKSWNSQRKFEYPYWDIELTEWKTGMITKQIIDGKTGRIIWKYTFFRQVIA